MPGDNKRWCSYWIQKGECAYTQQGCKYLHEMPDLATLRTIGFTHVPFWYKQNQEREKRNLDSWRASQLMNSNQTRAPNSPFAMPPRPIQASKISSPRHHTKAPTKTVNQTAEAPADLLDLEDHEMDMVTPSRKAATAAMNLNKPRPLPSAHSRTPKLNAIHQNREMKAGRAKPKNKAEIKMPPEPLVPVKSIPSDLLTPPDSRDSRS